jgi:GT2 family glycosyltransferase
MSIVEKEKTPFFTVVIPTYERPIDLDQSLKSLSSENQSNCPSYEIIVTDDSYSDRCKNLVKKQFPHVYWGKGKKTGPAGNRNAGVARAKGEWIVFIDDDCIAQPEFLSAYENAIKSDPKLGALEGRIYPDRPKKTWAEGCPENEYGGMFWTSNLCVKKSLFIELQGFDESFEVAFEDVDFAHRLAKAEINTTFVYGAAVCHPWRSLRSGGKNWKRKGYELESLALFLEKHPDASSKYGSAYTYLRHFCRMLSKDLAFCILHFKGRGIDTLLTQATTTLRTAWFVRKFKS